jgi:hypothetical protein
LDAELLLGFRRYADARLQLDEDRSPAIQDQHIGKPASHTAFLLKNTADPGDRLVLQRGPERAGRIEVFCQLPGKLRLLRPFLTLALAPTLHG